MKLKYKEDVREWRKSALLTALGLAVISSLLRWRRLLSANGWWVVLALLAIVSLFVVMRPRWFRGWYRLSLWLGFYSSQFIGRCVLALVFISILTPLGWLLRRLGKDSLQLKRPQGRTTYWQSAKDSSPLDRLF